MAARRFVSGHEIVQKKISSEQKQFQSSIEKFVLVTYGQNPNQNPDPSAIGLLALLDDEFPNNIPQVHEDNVQVCIHL